MTDTQGPRFMVFEQEAANKPHQHAGTVHAPDYELALLNARDVFVRRPQVCSLWVVRADMIYSKTVQELANPDWAALDEASGSGERESYHVFYKLDHKGTCLHAGNVQATSSPEAVQTAIEQFDRPDALWWWVVPSKYVHESMPDETESMFEPASSKYFRHQTQFTNQMLLRKMTADWRERQESDEE